MDFELLKTVCVVAIAGGVITTAIVQQLKSAISFRNSKNIIWLSLVVSLVIGTLFAKCFSELNWIYCVWSGGFTWLGAEAIYLALEEKVFTPFKDMQKEDDVTELPRGDEKTNE